MTAPQHSAMRPPGRVLQLLLAAVVVALAACTSPPPAPQAPTAPLPSGPGAHPPAPDAGTPRFEQQQLERAERALGAGRYPDAVLSWESLVLARPAHEPYRTGLARARQATEAELTQRLSRAAAAKQRGDPFAIERAWLDVLVVDPQNAAAARALRELESERTKSSSVGRFATPPAIAFANGAAGTAPSTPRPAERPTALPGPRNVVEHASMLAGQGEPEAAINLLVEQYGAMPADPTVRRVMAGLYLQRAEQNASRDSAAAVSDLERALSLNPRLEPARARLQQLRSGSAPR